MKTKLLIGVTVLALVFGAQAVLAECFIGGTITASSNPDPMGPVWMYTMVITWDTGSICPPRHFDLLMDSADGNCLCEDFMEVLSWDYPAGSSEGELVDCTVYYQASLKCDGDSAIPGADGILLKFQPIEGEYEPNPTGTGTFVFYSNLAPYPINEEILSVVDKVDRAYCFGYLSGDFPAMACSPVANEDANWGHVKGLFR